MSSEGSKYPANLYDMQWVVLAHDIGYEGSEGLTMGDVAFAAINGADFVLWSSHEPHLVKTLNHEQLHLSIYDILRSQPRKAEKAMSMFDKIARKLEDGGYYG